MLPATAGAGLVVQEGPLDKECVELAWDDTRQVGVITLDDPAHFNALGGASARSLAKAVKHVSAMAHACGFVLQAAGPHFCVGGNPYSAHVDMSMAALADNLLATARSCCTLRELPCPVTAAVHGHLAGGGVALCLNANYRVSDLEASFEHGNLIRGAIRNCRTCARV